LPALHRAVVVVHGYSFQKIGQFVQDELTIVYPPLKKIFDAGHLPDFLLLNLYTKQMLCVGFGRKNRIFILDAKSGKGINAFDLYGINDDSKYVEKFIKNDVYEATSDLLHALNNLSVTMYEYDHLPGNDDLVAFALDEENTRDGLHYIEGDDEGYTTEQINEFLEKYQEYVRTTSSLFPYFKLSNKKKL
jgi:hypothetical protein